jgi:hypothetical protein
VLAGQVFTEAGRRYVRGTPLTRCNFAYLENPAVREQNGLLFVEARFSRRRAADQFGHCVGLGDSFDLSMTAVPYCHNSVIRLKNVRVAARKDGFCIRLVRAALARSITRQFEYRVLEDARRILQEQREKAPCNQELIDFWISGVRVSPEALIVNPDFVLAVT